MKYHAEHGYMARLSTLYPHAIIDVPVEIGESTQIWHYTHVMDHAEIGDNCTLGQGVHVAPGVVIGNGCAIQNGVQLFTGVTLEDDVFVGPCATFTNVRTPRAFVDRKQDFKPTLVKRGASIGANATIVCGVTIDEYAMVGAGAVVTRSVGAHRIVVGNPAREAGWACRCGVRLTCGRLTTIFDMCRGCSSHWQLTGGQLTEL
jgi:UDP-2-acetamido-3-amino-2,3-dideoxy-glucuronate N-acetyltransferase